MEQLTRSVDNIGKEAISVSEQATPAAKITYEPSAAKIIDQAKPVAAEPKDTALDVKDNFIANAKISVHELETLGMQDRTVFWDFVNVNIKIIVLVVAALFAAYAYIQGHTRFTSIGVVVLFFVMAIPYDRQAYIERLAYDDALKQVEAEIINNPHFRACKTFEDQVKVLEELLQALDKNDPKYRIRYRVYWEKTRQCRGVVWDRKISSAYEAAIAAGASAEVATTQARLAVMLDGISEQALD